MATISKLQVELSLIDKMSAGLNKARGEVEQFGATARRVGAAATLGLTLPIIAGAGKVVMAASDLNEAISATETVYGKSSAGIIKWSKTTASSLGVSQEAALSAAVQFAGLGKAAGYTGDDLNQFSTDIVTAASDLASFYNTDPGTVLEDLRSGLAGESEPLRKYGIFLNEASVAQKAMEMTGKANAKQLTEGDKIAARSALIMEGLGDAQGDFARTSKGLANTLRILKARFKDLAATMGQALLPIALKLATAIGTLFDKLGDVSPGLLKFALAVVGVAAAIGPLLLLLGVLAPGFALLLSPIGLVAVALAGLLTLFPGLRSAAVDALSAVVDALGTVSRYFVRAFQSGESVKALVSELPGPLQALGRGFLLIADAVGDVVAAFTSGGLMAGLRAIPGELSQIWQGVQALASAALDIAIDTAVSIGGWLWEHRSDIWGGIKAAVGWTVDTFTDAVTAVVSGAISLAGELATAAADFGSWLWRTIKGNWDGIVRIGTLALDALIGYAGELKSLIDDVAGWIRRQLAWTGDKIVAVGKLILRADTEIQDVSGDSDRPGRNYVQKVVDGVKKTGALIDDAMTWFVGRSYQGIGYAIGSLAAAALGAAVLLVQKIADGIGDPRNIVSVALKVVDVIENGVGMGIEWAIGKLVSGDALTRLWTGLGQGFFDAAAAAGVDWGGIVVRVIEVGITAETLLGTGRVLFGGLLGGMQEKWIEIDEFLGTRGTAAILGVGDVGATLLQKGVDLLQGLWDGSTTKWQEISTWLGTRDTAAVNAIGDLSRTLYNKGANLFTGFKNGAQEKFDEVLDWAEGVGDDVFNAIPYVGNVLYSIGADIVQGMADGIAGAAYRVTNAVNAIVNSIPAIIRELMGLASPSKVMRKLFLGVPQGMALGLMDGKGLVQSAAGMLAESATVSASASVAGVTGMLGNGFGNGGATNHITLNQYINGDGLSTREIAEESFALFSRELGLTMGGG